MKRKLLIALILIMCICALTTLSSCDAILDIIFGPSTPPTPPPDDTHTHNLQPQTLDGNNCSGRDVTYYKCADCGKCYRDDKGEELVDESSLGAGHLYVLKKNDTQHYRECALCNTVQDGSREEHKLGDWLYNSQQHYKQCQVCDIILKQEEHKETAGKCSVCGRRGDYAAMCNSRYGYEQLATFERSSYMQALYNKIDEVVANAHNNANLDAKQGTFSDENKNEVNGYYITVSPDFSVTQDDVYITMTTYRHDNPLYYWIGRYLGGDTKNIRISVVDEYAQGSARIEQNNKIYDEIDKYLSYVSDETDIYTITLALHDRIIENINYAYDSDDMPETAHWAHSIVGVFDNKLAVCEGYAKAFQLLLNACGIDNVYVTGTSHDVGHAWNLVNLSDSGNKWYWYDLTWDDQPYIGRGITHKYFCKIDDEFDDHTVTTYDKTDTEGRQNYLYDLPAVATTPYETVGLEIDETFTLDGFTYKLVGYKRLSVYKCISGKDGVATIPATVVQGDVTYKVAEIDSLALVNYTYDKDNNIISKVSPTITKLVIPETVDLIYTKSFLECKTLVLVEFVDANGWSRYGLTGEKPQYKQVDSQQVSIALSARILLQELCYDTATPCTYAWIKG